MSINGRRRIVEQELKHGESLEESVVAGDEIQIVGCYCPELIGKDDVETPLRYSAGINASIDGARRIYRGKMAELNVLSSRLSCTRGCRISRCPTPVISSRGL